MCCRVCCRVCCSVYRTSITQLITNVCDACCKLLESVRFRTVLLQQHFSKVSSVVISYNHFSSELTIENFLTFENLMTDENFMRFENLISWCSSGRRGAANLRFSKSQLVTKLIMSYDCRAEIWEFPPPAPRTVTFENFYFPVGISAYLSSTQSSVLQCVAVCCSVLQCAAVCCSVLQCVAVCCSVLHCVVVCCIVLHACCSVLQGATACRSVLQWVVPPETFTPCLHSSGHSCGLELHCWNVL